MSVKVKKMFKLPSRFYCYQSGTYSVKCLLKIVSCSKCLVVNSPCDRLTTNEILEKVIFDTFSIIV